MPFLVSTRVPSGQAGMEDIIKPSPELPYIVYYPIPDVMKDLEWVLMEDFLLGPQQTDYYAISSTP